MCLRRSYTFAQRSRNSNIWFAATSWSVMVETEMTARLFDSFYWSRFIMFGKRACTITTSNIISYEWGKRQMAQRINTQGISAHLQPFECHCKLRRPRRHQTESTYTSLPTIWLHFIVWPNSCQAAPGQPASPLHGDASSDNQWKGWRGPISIRCFVSLEHVLRINT